MNLSTLVERTRSLSGVRLESVRTDAEIKLLVNESYEEVIGLFPWPFLRGSDTSALAVGQNTITLPVIFRFVDGVILDAGEPDERRLTPITLDRLDQVGDEEGDPRFYARVTDRVFKVWPTPREVGVITFRGQVTFTPLVADTSSPIFAEQFHVIVAYRAASKLLAEEGDDSGRAETYQLEAAGILKRMEDYYLASNDMGIIRIGSRRIGRRGAQRWLY